LYFGSVRFFKRLIVSVVILIILALAILAIVLAVESGQKSDEIDRLTADKIILQELVNAIYELDENTFNDIAGINADDESSGSGRPFPLPSEPLPNPYADLYPHLYTDFKIPESYKDDTGYIYLTFDDGPSVHTEGVLRYLDKHGVKATFFVMPADTENGKRYLNTMLETGHEIGVHTMSHIYEEIYESVESFLGDFNEAFNLIYEQTGYKPYLYRFPAGSINNFNGHIRKDVIAEMNRRGFVYYDWNVDSNDANDANWSQMYFSVLEDVSNVNRAVILFHDGPGRSNTVTVIEDIIKALLADPRGFTFSTITRDTRPMQF